MFLSLTAQRVTQSFVLDGENPATELILNCTSTDDRGVLEIGTQYAFAKKLSLANRRTLLSELRLYIRRRSRLTEERAAKLGLNEDKIGGLGFYPAYEKRDDIERREASLEAFAFVSDLVFDNLVDSSKHGKKPLSIQIDIANKTTLGYGWEPDGSRMEWKVENPKEPSYVDVTQITIEVVLFETP